MVADCLVPSGLNYHIRHSEQLISIHLRGRWIYEPPTRVNSDQLGRGNITSNQPTRHHAADRSVPQ